MQRDPVVRHRGARELADGVFALVLALVPAVGHGVGVRAPRTHGLAAAVVFVHRPDEAGGFVGFSLEGFAGAAAAQDEEYDKAGDEENADCDAGCYSAFCGRGETAVGFERVAEGEELGFDYAG